MFVCRSERGRSQRKAGDTARKYGRQFIIECFRWPPDIYCTQPAIACSAHASTPPQSTIVAVMMMIST
eukprot:1158867-Pelagomonas_calceolata.AAC.33